jgi:hypothetical protein
MKDKLSRFWTKWKRFGERMSNYFGIGLFAVMYFTMFAPLAILFKIMGRKFLPHFNGDEPTFFLPKARIEPTLESMEKQG